MKVGDRVKPESTKVHHGKLGTVVKMSGNGNVSVEFDEPITNGHDCDGLTKYGHGYNYTYQNSLEVLEETMKLGDRVRPKNGKDYAGKLGTIVHIDTETLRTGVEFDEDICGHDCNGFAKKRYGYNYSQNSLEVIQMEEMKKPTTELEKKGAEEAKKEAIEDAIIRKKEMYASSMRSYLTLNSDIKSLQNQIEDKKKDALKIAEALNITDKDDKQLF